MAVTLGFYNDSGLTSAAASLAVVQAADGSSAAVDRVVYLGSPAAGKKFQANSDPGVDDIVVSVADTTPAGGVAASSVRLALTSGGLDSATPGAALAIDPEILSGAANAVAIHVRVETPATAAGLYTDLSLTTNAVIELVA